MTLTLTIVLHIIKLILALIAGALSLLKFNEKDERICVYWLLVTFYWVINFLQGLPL